MPPAPPAPGTGACGISAGWKRRAARYENENSLQNPDSRAGSTRDPWRPAVVCAYAGRQKIPICRYFTGATGLEPATSGVTGRRSNQLNYAPWRAGHCTGLTPVRGDSVSRGVLTRTGGRSHMRRSPGPRQGRRGRSGRALPANGRIRCAASQLPEWGRRQRDAIVDLTGDLHPSSHPMTGGFRLRP